MYRSIREGSKAEEALLIPFELGEPVVAEAWERPFSWGAGPFYESFDIEASTWADFVHDIKGNLLVIFRSCIFSLS